jgi:hypothetical protein
MSKSKFLNVSPRVYIRQRDSVNILPRILRTGYQNELGDETNKFDDGETVIFEDNQTVLAPYMIPSGSAALSGFFTGSLSLTGPITDRASYFDKAVINEPIFPFKERFKTISETSFDIGFPQSEYPGFSSPPSDKVALVFDMSSPNDFTLSKLKLSDSLLDPSGPLYNTRASGFAYYDHTNKTWTDVGIADRASNAAVDYDPVLRLDGPSLPSNYEIDGNNQEILSQFSSSPNSIVTETYYQPKSIDDLKARGYHKIGEPTSFFGAPHAPRYHAKGDQTIKLKDYITAPFVVDRIEAKFPVIAFRTQTPSPVGPPPPLFSRGFARDIDNYVFFVYVQNRSNAVKDTTQDVSSSIRYLIGKESFCFSNQQTLNEVYLDQKPIHDVTQSFFFNMGSFVNASLTYSTDIFLNFRPKTFNQEFGTPSKLPARGLSGAMIPVTGSVFTKNFWRGGQYASGTLGDTFLITDTANFNARRGSFNTIEEFADPNTRALATSFWEGTSETIVTGSGFRTTGQNISTVSQIDSSRETPVVLFPDDELIFGIESGVNSVMNNPNSVRSGLGGEDQSVLAVTGSRLIVKAGTGYVILYGTMISDKVEVLPSLNQYLGSDAVHEDIHEAGPYDQFDIYSKSILSASYVDNFITGSIFDGTRGRVFLKTSCVDLNSGSIQRNIRYVDSQRVFYDTLVPQILEISGGLAQTNYSASTNPALLTIKEEVGKGFAFDNDRSTPAMLKRAFTYQNTEGAPRLKNISLKLINTTGMLTSTLEGEDAKFALYYNGQFNSKSFTTKNYTGAASLRYGLLSPRLVGPSCVFRRDRFGQFRDLLEQSRDSKTLVTIDGKDTVNRSIVYATFVSASSDLSVEPETTQCSNLSFECTSSIPFIDDNTVHNRGALPLYAVAFGPNNLIFGVTGSFGYQ